jgi:hypothetical protein
MVLHLSAAEPAYIAGTEIIADGGMSQLLSEPQGEHHDLRCAP